MSIRTNFIFAGKGVAGFAKAIPVMFSTSGI
jgi:hypothetical protein